MKNYFENSLSIGLVMSMYDFDIPVDLQTDCAANSQGLECCTIRNLADSDDGSDPTWLNGELSWKL